MQIDLNKLVAENTLPNQLHVKSIRQTLSLNLAKVALKFCVQRLQENLFLVMKNLRDSTSRVEQDSS